MVRDPRTRNHGVTCNIASNQGVVSLVAGNAGQMRKPPTIQVNKMDDLDMNDLIQVAAEDKTRMVTLELESGQPVASTIKSLFARPKVERVEITPEQQAALNQAWAKRVEAMRRMKDNDDPRYQQQLKKAYFAAIDNYKRLHKQVYGE